MREAKSYDASAEVSYPAAAFPPPYGQGTLAEVVPSLMASIGSTVMENSLALEPARSVCLLLVDGMGWELLMGSSTHAPFLAELAQLARGPLVAGFPATTATSLASLGTGMPPGRHGIVGYSFYVPEVGVLNALRWHSHGTQEPVDLRAILAPEDAQPLPTLFERASASGISVRMVGPGYQARSGLTRAALRGATYDPVRALGDLAAAALRTGAGEFCYVYLGDLDMIGHLYGPRSLAWKLQLGQVDTLAASIAERLPTDAVLAVTADHGMISVKEDDLLDLDAEPELLKGIRHVGGEVRVRHLYTEPGATAEVLSRWGETLDGRAEVVSREAALDEGWFGSCSEPRVYERIGDVVVAALDSFGIVRRTTEPLESRLIGHHGSFSSAEQLIPFLLLRG